MKVLIDTHALIWFQTGDRRLSKKARAAIEAPESERFISVASVWEMAIKASLGSLELAGTVQQYIEERVARGYQTLPIQAHHAAAVERLPAHHRDPFDRLIVVQSLVERLPVVTRDPIFGAYGVKTIW